MGKEGHVHKEPQGIFGGNDVPPGDVHAVTDALEGIKADAQRHGNGQNRQGAGQQGVDVFRHKVRILEKAQGRQVADHRRPKQQTVFRCPADGQPRRPVEGGKGQQDRRAAPARPDDKDQAEQCQHGVSPPGGQYVVGRPGERQKGKEKLDRGKTHGLLP